MAAPVEQLFSNLEKLLSNEDHAEAIDVRPLNLPLQKSVAARALFILRT